MFWIFPYFMEPQIISANPSFQMMDYKVEYKNHEKFQQGDFTAIATSIYLDKLLLWISFNVIHYISEFVF